MKRLLIVLILVLGASISVVAQDSFSRLPAPRAWFTSGLPALYLPFDVTTTDGVELKAGLYRVQEVRKLLVPVGRPPVSLGFWPGPAVYLYPEAGDKDGDQTPLPFVRLKTAVEALVIYVAEV